MLPPMRRTHPLPLALLTLLPLPACHETATHADHAQPDAPPPLCADLRQLEPCPQDLPLARLWIAPYYPTSPEVLSSLWTYNDPTPITGWTLYTELCIDPNLTGTLLQLLESAPTALLWSDDGSFDRLDRWTTPSGDHYQRTTCVPDSTTAIERTTLQAGRTRIEAWPPRP